MFISGRVILVSNLPLLSDDCVGMLVTFTRHESYRGLCRLPTSVNDRWEQFHKEKTKMDVIFRVNFLKGAGNVCTSFHFTPETILNKSNIIFWYHLHHLISYISICIPKIFPHQRPPQLPSTISITPRYWPVSVPLTGTVMPFGSTPSARSPGCAYRAWHAATAVVSLASSGLSGGIALKSWRDFFCLGGLGEAKDNKRKTGACGWFWLVRFDV